VLGTQWGDEGKGKLVDILAHQYDIVARAQVKFLSASRPNHSIMHHLVGELCGPCFTAVCRFFMAIE
jgi:hypothetical protein